MTPDATMRDLLLGHAADLRAALDGLAEQAGAVEAAATAIADALRGGGTLLVAGNGGSAAEAQHLSAEFIGRLRPDRERPALAAVALHADTSALTAAANDYGYERVFARQVEAIGRRGDVLVVLSTSGASPNCLAAVEAARERGIATVGLLGGTPRALHDLVDVAVAVPSDGTATVQECHLVLVHVLTERVEDLLGLVPPPAA